MHHGCRGMVPGLGMVKMTTPSRVSADATNVDGSHDRGDLGRAMIAYSTVAAVVGTQSRRGTEWARTAVSRHRIGGAQTARTPAMQLEEHQDEVIPSGLVRVDVLPVRPEHNVRHRRFRTRVLREHDHP